MKAIDEHTRTVVSALGAALTVLAFIVAVALTGDAEAQPPVSEAIAVTQEVPATPPVTEAMAVMQMAPAAIGPGYLDDLDPIICDADGAQIRSTHGQLGVWCTCDSAVNWGKATVTSSTGAAKDEFSAMVRVAYCAAANVTCNCTALVANNPDA